MGLADLDNCLFCGVALNDETRTREDVFPKWLQQEYDLAEFGLTLLNGSTIKYPRLKVPACRPCNNVHASQLEARVKSGVATDQEMWIWLLKLQLGTMAFETTRRWKEDRRDPLAEEPIVEASTMDLGFLHGLFEGLRSDRPQFAPDPLGTVISFADGRSDFFYTDRFYRHPESESDHNYSASCIRFHGRCWIALFDDAGNVRDALDVDKMNALVEEGYDPVMFLPDLMFLRAQLDYMPKSLMIGPSDGLISSVMFVPPLFKVPRLSDDPAILELYRNHFLGSVVIADD